MHPLSIYALSLVACLALSVTVTAHPVHDGHRTNRAPSVDRISAGNKVSADGGDRMSGSSALVVDRPARRATPLRKRGSSPASDRRSAPADICGVQTNGGYNNGQQYPNPICNTNNYQSNGYNGVVNNANGGNSGTYPQGPTVAHGNRDGPINSSNGYPPSSSYPSQNGDDNQNSRRESRRRRSLPESASSLSSSSQSSVAPRKRRYVPTSDGIGNGYAKEGTQSRR
ncbi:hypothetical protein BGZ98_001407 [Dissophora globulifera]|nr:hypothetical protein BGZ98_001407 [Dissophora globulifera]